MSFTDDFRAARQRFPQHVRAVEDVLRRHNIESTKAAWDGLADPAFREHFSSVLKGIMESEGGKLSFGLVFAIVGAALGGVGVAALGGAVGVPLALIGALVGLVVGNELDTAGQTSKFLRKLRAFWNTE